MNTSTDSANSSPATSKSWIPLLLIALIAGAAGVYFGTTRTSDNAQSGSTQAESSDSERTLALQAVQEKLINTTILPDDFKRVPAFSLLHGSDTELTESALKDKWSLLFFGFTNCPDVCPITLNEVDSAFVTLNESNTELPQVFFVTVDPVRDTPEKMVEYAAYFNDDFIGASGDLADITSLTSKLGVVASYTASEDDPKEYTVDHTASILLIDPELRVRAKFNPPHTADTIAADFNTILSSIN